MSLILTPLFYDDFTSDSIQDPLNPANWTVDISEPAAGGLCVAAALSPLSGKTGQPDPASEYTPGSWDAGEYYNGNSPLDGYIKAIVGDLPDNGVGVSLVYGCATPFALFDQGCFYMEFVGPMNAVQCVLWYVDPLGVSTNLLEIDNVPLVAGDSLYIAYVGKIHYILKNSASNILGQVSTDFPNYGGAGTGGIFINGTGGAPQLLGVKFGTAQLNGSGSNSSWLSVAANNILRGSRSH